MQRKKGNFQRFQRKFEQPKPLKKHIRSYMVGGFLLLVIILLVNQLFKESIDEELSLENRLRIITIGEENDNFTQCGWIKKLLKHGPSLSKDLPEPGKQRPAGKFWLKRPLKHTKYLFSDIPTFQSGAEAYFTSQLDSEGFVELMILRYNVYKNFRTQHTDKYMNTVHILENTTLSSLSIFPKLYGKCADIDGFHTIVIEYLPYVMNELPKPITLDNCVNRAYRALDLFHQLHSLSLIHVDIKKGQWMARSENSFVFQDIDDIVVNNSVGAYEDQIESFQNNLKENGAKQVKQLWERLFPNKKLTDKYNIFGIEVLLNDLGFTWTERDCLGFNDKFKQCFKNIIKATKNIMEPDRLPSFLEVKNQLKLCYLDRLN